MEESFRNLTRVPVPKISSKVANVPAEVEALLAAMMEKKPEKRIATAQATQYKISAIIGSLKEESEAKTAHGSLPKPGKVNIDDLSSSATRFSDAKTEGPSSSKGRQKKADSSGTKLSSNGANTIRKNSLASDPQANGVDKKRSSAKTQSSSTSQPDAKSHKPKASRTRKNTARKRKGKKIADPGEDYFTSVTEEHRAALQIDSDYQERPTAKWPLVLLLLVSVGAATLGTWFATKNPSADALYAAIEQSCESPEDVIEETENFMKLYKSDERFGEVELLNEVGHSLKHYSSLVKRLSVRARIPGDSRLTEIEDQFMKIIALGNTEPKKADAKMEAFINVHSTANSLSERDMDCVKAAHGFRIKIVGAEDRQIENYLRRINSSINRAKSSEPQEAKELYASLIQLYDDDNWGQRDNERTELLKEVKDLYDSAVELESEETPELEETPVSEE